MSMDANAPSLPIYSRRLTAAGTAYVERGQGEPLVLIHGVGMRLEAWWQQIESLSNTHRVIAVDMPGHGESAALPEGSQLPDFVGWLGGFVDEMQLGPINLAGHSMGALIAGGAAASFGNRIRRVALLNGVYRRDGAAKAAVLARAASIATQGIDIEGPLQRWFATDAVSLAARALAEQCLRQMDMNAYRTAYTAFANGDETYADHWPQVSCPALFLTGSGDPNSTPAMAEEMAALAIHGTAKVIDGHRHMVNLTAPEQVHDIMSAWLALPEVHS
jgi:(E)-2-((N-methylformamido)methylene)succinate hydrolase